MRKTGRSTIIKKIMDLVNTPPEPDATFWLYENGIYYRYNEQSGTWEHSTLEIMKQESNGRSWLFLTTDDEEPAFKGQCMAIAGHAETREYLTSCQCSPEEIETRLKNHPTAREMGNEVIKAIFIHT